MANTGEEDWSNLGYANGFPSKLAVRHIVEWMSPVCYRTDAIYQATRPAPHRHILPTNIIASEAYSRPIILKASNIVSPAAR